MSNKPTDEPTFSKADMNKVYRYGQMKGLTNAANTIENYIKEFSPTGDALMHAECLRSGIAAAANLISLSLKEA